LRTTFSIRTNPVSGFAVDCRLAQFYNAALAIVAGVGAAAFSFRVIPPLSPAFRTQRLLELTLRDLHRLATGPIPRTPADWESRMYGRFSALPDQAQPLQRSQLMAAFSRYARNRRPAGV